MPSRCRLSRAPNPRSRVSKGQGDKGAARPYDRAAKWGSSHEHRLRAAGRHAHHQCLRHQYPAFRRADGTGGVPGDGGGLAILRRHGGAAGARQRPHRRGDGRRGGLCDVGCGGGGAAGARRLHHRPRSRQDEPASGHHGHERRDRGAAQPSEFLRPCGALARGEGGGGRHLRPLQRHRRARRRGLGDCRRHHRAHCRGLLSRQAVFPADAAGGGCRREKAWRAGGGGRGGGAAAGGESPPLHRRGGGSRRLQRRQGDRRAPGLRHPHRTPGPDRGGGAAEFRSRCLLRPLRSTAGLHRQGSVAGPAAARHRPPLQGRKGGGRGPADGAPPLPHQQRGAAGTLAEAQWGAAGSAAADRGAGGGAGGEPAPHRDSSRGVRLRERNDGLDMRGLVRRLEAGTPSLRCNISAMAEGVLYLSPACLREDQLPAIAEKFRAALG
jgi:hypothetical protein